MKVQRCTAMNPALREKQLLLAAAHDRGVMHRDLKSANVMLDGAGKIRITDFGLASVAASIQGADARAGTPAYMAPEQLAGREVTAKSDLYSLGLILYSAPSRPPRSLS
jgi:serine/threonine protein kinase